MGHRDGLSWLKVKGKFRKVASHTLQKPPIPPFLPGVEGTVEVGLSFPLRDSIGGWASNCLTIYRKVR